MPADYPTCRFGLGEPVTPIADMPWRKIRAYVLDRDQYICAYCLDPANQVDHLLPVARGGMNDPINLTAACGPCNQSKGALTPHEWAARDGMRLPPWFYERHPS